MAPSRATFLWDVLQKCAQGGVARRATRTSQLSSRSLRPLLKSPRPALSSLRLAHTIPKPPPQQARPAPSEPPASTTASAPPSTAASSTTGAADNNTPSSAAPTLPTGPGSRQPRPAWKQPTYEVTFTCLPCGHRSTHTISKQGYHKGSVLVTCPSCRNRHVMSDHLRLFGDRAVTVEDLMRDRGRLVKRGALGEDGDIEFWEDEETGRVMQMERGWAAATAGAGEGSASAPAAAEEREPVDPDAAPGASFKSVAGKTDKAGQA